MNRSLRILLPAVLSLALAACAPRAKPAADPRARAEALIDAGNAAFKAGDFDGAARRYASAAVVNPDDPAAFYGLGMALSRLGRDEEARAAYAKSRDLSRDAGAPAPEPSAGAGRGGAGDASKR